jgi:hypothetical protein
MTVDMCLYVTIHGFAGTLDGKRVAWRGTTAANAPGAIILLVLLGLVRKI